MTPVTYSETTGSPLRVRLLHVPDCPLVDHVRLALREALRNTGMPVVVDVHVGAYPSPTLLVGDTDVLTGQPHGGEPCCRLELPTAGQIAAALRHANRFAGTGPTSIPTTSP